MKTISALRLVVKPAGWRQLPVFATLLAALALPSLSSGAATSVVTINIAGNGTVTGGSFIKGDTVPANGALLNVGETYALTARPGLDCFFEGWTGTALTTVGATNGPTLKFIMQPGTTITANFITNVFIQMAGTYYGLFSSTNVGAATVETAGLIGNLRFDSRGVYSAMIYLGGSGRGITGYFTHDGAATNRATNTVLDGNVRVELQMHANTDPRTITGLLIGTNSVVDTNGNTLTNWTSELTMYASLTNASNYARAYTMLIPPPTNGYGYGYACLTNYPGAAAYRGNAAVPPYLTLIGALSDWASFSQTWPICEDSAIPVYQNYYNTPNLGMIFGKLGLTTNPPTLSGTLTWIKRPMPFSRVFTNGFTNYPVVQGSYWSNLVPLDTVISANSQLVLSNIVPTLSVTNLVTVSHTNLLSQKGAPNYTNFYSATVNTNSGELTVIFTNHSVPAYRYAVGHAVVLQNAGSGGGFFILGPGISPTNIGSITLHPSP